MFTKFANEGDFDTLLAEGMKDYLSKEYGEKFDIEKQASQEAKEESKKVFAFVVEELVKCAETLEDLGHPLSKEVDEVLAKLEVEFKTLGKKKVK